jgi:hypothetical protein
VSPSLTGLAVNPDKPTRLGIVQPLFHQAKVELALGRQRFARPGLLTLIRICHLQLLKDQVLRPPLEPERLELAPQAPGWAGVGSAAIR